MKQKTARRMKRQQSRIATAQKQQQKLFGQLLFELNQAFKAVVADLSMLGAVVEILVCRELGEELSEDQQAALDEFVNGPKEASDDEEPSS